MVNKWVSALVFLFFMGVEVSCDITCVSADISAADVKYMIWKFQNVGVIFLFSYVYCFCACEQDGTLIIF